MAWRMLLGLVGALVVCGAVAARPPGLQPDPHAEGRELDPVTRDFHLPPGPPAADEAAPPRTAPGALWALLLHIQETILHTCLP